MWELSKTGRIDKLFVFRRSGTRHVVVGVLVFEGRGRVRRGRFQYASSYLRNEGRWAIDPVSLQLGPGWRDASPSEAPLAFHDSGPDGWGKSIVDRAYPDLELGIAEYLASGGGRRTGDLLYGPTPDRPEAWRPAVGPSREPAVEDDVGALLDAAMEAEEGEATADQIALLVPSSAVGGARPKARVRIGGRDWIAKFPSSSDRFDDPRMEAVCLDVAEAAGIAVPERSLLRLRRRTALLVRRFDRDDRGGALAYLSAGTLLRQGTDVYVTNQTYLDIALVGQRIGASDMREEMYRRYVVNSLLHNTDDHLRNHGFLGDAGGWRLSPAFDVVPYVGKPTHVCAAAPGMEHGWDPGGARHAHRKFGLSPGVGEEIHERAVAAFSRIREFMDAREVTQADRAFVLEGLAASVALGRPAPGMDRPRTVDDARQSGGEVAPTVGGAGHAGDAVKLVVTRAEVRRALRRLRDGADGSPSDLPSHDVRREGGADPGPVARALMASGRFVLFRAPATGADATEPWRVMYGVEALQALEAGFGRGRFRSLEVDVGGLRRTSDQGCLASLDEALAYTAGRRAGRTPPNGRSGKDGKDEGLDDP